MTKKGFTLIELAVVMAIIAVLAGVLTPVVSNYIDEARRTRAASETQSIASAILGFNKDTGKWPIFVAGGTITTSSTIYTTLQGPGSDPACTGCGSTWLPAAGNRGDVAANLVNASRLGFGLKKAAFVLSAGPNGTVETTFDQNIGSGSAAVTIGGDDIVSRIR
jgi:prepilin-type N-terminal cleavage/methylation domain-containing protein